MADPLARRKAAREAAVAGITGPHRREATSPAEPAPEVQDEQPSTAEAEPAAEVQDKPAPAAAAKPSKKAATPRKRPAAKKTATRRASTAPPPVTAPAAPPATVDAPMPPPRRDETPRVQFNARIRLDVSELLVRCVSTHRLSKQDVADLALLEWLARREYQLPGEHLEPPELPDLAAPGHGDSAAPMPPARRDDVPRVQLNTRIRRDVSQLLNQCVDDHRLNKQDVADLALLEWLAVRGYLVK